MRNQKSYSIILMLIFVFLLSISIQSGVLSYSSEGYPSNDIEESDDFLDYQQIDDKGEPESELAPVEPPSKDIVVRVLIGRTRGKAEFSSMGGLSIKWEKNVDSNGDKKVFEKDLVVNIIPAADKNKKETEQKESSIEISLDESVFITPLMYEGTIKAGDKRYRGAVKVLNHRGTLLIINYVPLEKYLYGVVPKEFKTTSLELSKTQAVVARTFALGHLGRFEQQGYDFTDGTAHQVYGGFDAEDALCSQAVDETAGEIITFEGKLAKFPLYHSTCGGATSDNEMVFLTQPVPYLRGQQCRDLEEITEIKNVGANQTEKNSSSSKKTEFSSNENSKNKSSKNEKKHPLNDSLNLEISSEYCEDSRLYRWQVEWSNDELSKVIDDSYMGEKTGKIQDIIVEKRGECGRIAVIMVKTDKDEYRIRGDEIRKSFKFKNEKNTMSNLYSTRFNIYKIHNNGEIRWVFKGSGWGHGVGMCQFGALKMARKGFSYIDVLKKYFIGIAVENSQNLPEFKKLYRNVDESLK